MSGWLRLASSSLVLSCSCCLWLCGRDERRGIFSIGYSAGVADARQTEYSCLAYQPVVVRSPRARDGRGLRGLGTPGGVGICASLKASHMPGWLRVEEDIRFEGEKDGGRGLICWGCKIARCGLRADSAS